MIKYTLINKPTRKNDITTYLILIDICHRTKQTNVPKNLSWTNCVIQNSNYINLEIIEFELMMFSSIKYNILAQ